MQRIRVMIKYRKQVHLPGHHKEGKERGDVGDKRDLENLKKSMLKALLPKLQEVLQSPILKMYLLQANDPNRVARLGLPDTPPNSKITCKNKKLPNSKGSVK